MPGTEQETAIQLQNCGSNQCVSMCLPRRRVLEQDTESLPAPERLPCSWIWTQSSSAMKKYVSHIHSRSNMNIILSPLQCVLWLLCTRYLYGNKRFLTLIVIYDPTSDNLVLANIVWQHNWERLLNDIWTNEHCGRHEMRRNSAYYLIRLKLLQSCLSDGRIAWGTPSPDTFPTSECPFL